MRVRSLSDCLLAAQGDGREEQRVALEAVTAKVAQLTESNEKRRRLYVPIEARARIRRAAAA